MNEAHKITRFVSYFRRQVDFVSTLAGEQSIVVDTSDPETRGALHKKVLFSAILDCLAGVRYRGELQGNRKRFMGLLESHADWAEGDHVSVPIFFERLGKDAQSSALRDRLLKNLSRYSTDRGNSLPLKAFDEPFTDLEKLASTERERKMLVQSRHFELLYKYRNFIVHEFREPGYAMEAFADGGEAPAYHSYLGPGAKWRLLYPVGFFRARASAALISLEQYFRTHGIDPYSRVAPSDTWFSEN